METLRKVAMIVLADVHLDDMVRLYAVSDMFRGSNELRARYSRCSSYIAAPARVIDCCI